MGNPAVQFPPLTTNQKYLLEEIEYSLNELKVFNGRPLPLGPDLLRFEQIRNTLDDLTPKALRSGLIKQDPNGILYLHPELPSWAKSYFKEWFLTHRALGARTLLRSARIGLERGVKRPYSLKQLELKDEVLRLRNVREEDVIGEYGPEIRPNQKKREQKKRIRKERQPWSLVTRQVVKRKLLDRQISPQGLKKMLRNLFLDIDWDKV
jgi:hypothetical protein